MQNNVLNFEPDKPQIIALKYRQGKEFNKNGYHGFTYTLVNGLRAFFPVDVDREIQALHLDAGQPIRITKKSSGAWDIERVAGGSGESTAAGSHPQVSCASVDTRATGDGAQRARSCTRSRSATRSRSRARISEPSRFQDSFSRRGRVTEHVGPSGVDCS